MEKCQGDLIPSERMLLAGLRSLEVEVVETGVYVCADGVGSGCLREAGSVPPCPPAHCCPTGWRTA